MKTMNYWPQTGLMMDWSGMGLDDAFLNSMAGKINAALAGMKELEGGAIANPDEGRMVGHYWLRAPELAPNAELKAEIEDCVAKIKDFVAKVHSGEVKTEKGDTFSVTVLYESAPVRYTEDGTAYANWDATIQRVSSTTGGNGQ